MNIFSYRFLFAIVSVFSAVFPVTAHAQYDTVFLDAAQGEIMTHVRLGLGETPPSSDGEKVTSMFYVSYFKSRDEVITPDANLGEQDVEILAIGAGGFGYLDDPTKNGGAEFDFEWSKTTIDSLDYERQGLGLRTQIFIPVVAGLQSNIGFNLRPFFLSPDWDDQSQLEYEYQAGFEYAFNWDVAVYAHYRYIALIDTQDENVKLAEGTLLGLRARF